MYSPLRTRYGCYFWILVRCGPKYRQRIHVVLFFELLCPFRAFKIRPRCLTRIGNDAVSFVDQLPTFLKASLPTVLKELTISLAEKFSKK